MPDIFGWDSLETVSRIQSTARIIGIALLGFLVIAEAIDFVYDRREHTLAGIADRAAAEDRKRQQREADERHTAETSALRGQAEEAAKKVAALHSEAQAKTAETQARMETLKQQFARRFPDRQLMLPILREATGIVELLYDREDFESTKVAEILRLILIESGWTVSAIIGLSTAELAQAKILNDGWWYLETRSMPKDGMISGSRIGMNLPPDPDADKTPFSILVGALLRGIGAPGIMTGASENPSLPEGKLRLYILPRL